MKHFKYAVGITVVFCLFLVLFTQTAYAYLDPGSGSYIIQLLIGSLLGSLYLIKRFWSKIKFFISGIFNRGKHD